MQCSNCFWGCSAEGCSDVCCGKLTQRSLLLLPRIPSVQHSASADYPWDTSCLFCWNVLPRCLVVCVAFSNEVNQSISSVLLSLVWPLPAVLLHRCERTCHAAYVPVSVEVYMCSSPSLPKVYREKAWLSWPAKVTQQQLVMLSSTFVSMWIGWWSPSVGMCAMASALGWCDVLARSVTSGPYAGMCGCSVLLCQSPGQMAESSFIIWQSLILLWMWQHQALSTVHVREPSTVLQPVNTVRDMNCDLLGLKLQQVERFAGVTLSCHQQLMFGQDVADRLVLTRVK